MRLFLLVFLFILAPFQAGSLFGLPENADPQSRDAATERNLASLKTIAEPLNSSLSELEILKAEAKQADTEDARKEIQKRIDAERERIEELRENFRSVVGGSEAAEYDEITTERATLQEQISELVQPVLSGLREATAEPRELDALRKSLKKWTERKQKIDIVLDRIDQLSVAADDEALQAELKSARRIWSGREAEANSNIAVAQVQIEERAREQRSLWETLSSGFQDFFKSRGMNLLFAILAAVIGFYATRKTYSYLRRISPVHKKEKSNFTSRISDILAMGIAVLIAISGIILVFYARGDWLLLTLVVIFLIGIIWAGKTAIPPYLEQIRMILNLGSVREGERVIYAGLPWKVKKLGFFTTFTNPNLQGGRLRIPIRDVMEMISRPVEPKEVWFPSEVDDWVILNDQVYGKAIIQTPDQVVLLRQGGAKKTYPTADYLELCPLNLSHGFRVSITFGIDYKHQAECTTTVPEVFKAALLAGILGKFGRDAVRSIQVEFSAAAASSLDYEILADFDGSVADKYNQLRRMIQKICVESCTENGWGMPFTQITVHHTGAEYRLSKSGSENDSKSV